MHRSQIFALLLSILASTYLNAAEYMGAEQCKACHPQEYRHWQSSHHAMSMKVADENSVLADFNDLRLTLSGLDIRFYKKGKQYWVNMRGPDGKHRDYQIKYTFGYQPLQQYMVEFADGRLQLIPLAWDSRDKKQGGQRWFNLYPQMTEKHQEFYWTNSGQNWNYMCADCHSTHVSKNYNLKKNSYKTSWSEINVACEACHGPAGDHIKWTRNRSGDTGFKRDLGKPVKQWLNPPGKSILQPESIQQSQQALMCAQCHSRHTQLSDNDHVASGSIGDRYRLNLINRQNYFVDGQMYDEVYVYGSFLQSKMAQRGVTCSNCHDPHSAKLKLPVESLCIQCHESASYNTAKHHHHSATPTGQAPGTRCIDCHMPQTTYMQIDPRADHSWPVPRPDLSLKLGTPDTCLSCHQDKDSQWSLARLKAWYPASKVDKSRHFATAFTLADRGYPQASTELTRVAQDKNYAPVIRASALQRMQNMPDQNSYISIARGVRDTNELVRMAAAQGAQNMPAEQRWQLLNPLLKDKVLAVRAEAASSLAPLWQGLSPQQQAALEPALDDYLAIQNFNADRGFSHTNRGNILAYIGQDTQAEAAYRTSIRIEPGYSAAYVNLAELYRRQQAGSNNNEDNIIAILKQGLKAQPDAGDIYYSLGLSMIRSQNKSAAIDYLKQASELEPQNAHYLYVYALSLVESQPELAQQLMARTWQISGNPRHLYALCELQIKQRSFQARQCVSRLEKIVPADIIAPLKQMLSGAGKK